MVSEEFDIDAARRNLDSRIEEKKRIRRELHARALADSKRIIDMIIARFNPERIYQWGSLLKPEQFDENSDIDIAVEGLKSAEDFFACFGEAEEMTNFPLDLVELEKVHPLHIDSIVNKGTLVYERKK